MGRNNKATLPPELLHLYQGKFYKTWVNMKSRCSNPNVKRYSDYGARGIGYDPKWHTFMGFYDDMFSSYKTDLTLDRVNNDKGYSKENCKWSTRIEQNNNTRRNRFFTIDGDTKTIAQWVRYFGLKHSTVSMRIHYGWPLEKALEVASHRNS